jgi:four helix bundle protein
LNKIKDHFEIFKSVFGVRCFKDINTEHRTRNDELRRIIDYKPGYMMNNEESTKVIRFDLEERLINYSILVTEIVETILNTRAGNHYAGQLIRSGTSPALNYAEAQSGESRKDFIHKLKIVLKELRETLVCLKIISRTSLCKSKESVKQAIVESNELISIFVKSIETAQNNMQRSLRNF